MCIPPGLDLLLATIDRRGSERVREGHGGDLVIVLVLNIPRAIGADNVHIVLVLIEQPF